MSTRTKARALFEKELGAMTFGAFLTAVRLNVDLSQAELAKRLKVSGSMICDIEKGRVVVSPALAMKIARLGQFPEDLAVKYCLQDQLQKAKIRMKVSVRAA